MDSTGASAAAPRLDNLPLDALAVVLRHLSVQDVAGLARVNRSFREQLGDERVWQLLCAREWPATDARRWVVEPPGPNCSPVALQGPLPPPRDYKDAYMLLHDVGQLVGTWRLLGEGSASSLVLFSFTRDGLQGQELAWSSLQDEPERSEWLTISPAHGLCVEVQSVDSRLAALRQYSMRGGSGIHRCPSAEAAAQVAMGSGPGSSSPLGTSPQASSPFFQEFSQFLSPLVQARRRQRKRDKAQRSPGQVGRGGFVVHHLERVQLPQRTRQHPYQGLWIADCGPAHSIQVLRICMDFTGSAARLLAWKVTGDMQVPAGRLAWCALAAPLPMPWPAEELDLIAEQQERWLEQEDGWPGPGEGPLGRQVLQVHRGWGQEGPAVHTGVPELAHMCEARLWVFSSDHLAFLFLDGVHEVAELRRVDADILAVAPRP